VCTLILVRNAFTGNEALTCNTFMSISKSTLFSFLILGLLSNEALTCNTFISISKSALFSFLIFGF
jgi:hypothetical protein